MTDIVLARNEFSRLLRESGAEPSLIASFDRLNILIRGHVTTWRGGFYPQLFYIEITDLFIDHRPRIDVRVGYLAVLPAIVR